MSSVVVVGLGYVGVPLAQLAVARGLQVTGLDTSERTVAGLNAGRSHIDDLSDADVAAMVTGGFTATTDPAVVAGVETVVICVPTPLDPAGGPDLSMVKSAARSIAPHLTAGTLVVLESTTYPGTTEEVLGPILEEGSGLRVGVPDGLALAFSPERVDPGNPTFGIHNTPKVVGGATEECSRRAAEFYGRLAETVVVAKGTREAEMSKLLENTYRQVNIALVNEMARFSHELSIDFWDVIRLARTKPFGFQAFYPGPGVGGHCIPIDPNYLSHRVQEQLGYPFRFVELAQEINSGMPRYVAQRIQSLLNERSLPVKGAKILLLGVTYKPDIADQRESPAIPLARLLLSMGAEVSYADPHVAQWLVEGTNRADDPALAAAEADITVLLQQHRDFDVDAIADKARCLFDLRGVTAGENVERL
ncbi:nucleotide sugar dehydrogenase [Nocardioides sp. MAH-18]|uniref:Nucleotide sugar dehydrogenase n=1 Tax=Nocardioides agri TaxID=2682843 RepID=A0A6L6XUF5_9ACTN|nr:nucleotide sugar dehydrogenase [Nocardioides sp. CGMCC 1.13656]MBA2955562.1 nucleotide sugar dehydrogenase [Nocardioides sp. CGMCC 1.13656]MVQ50412.1 nucleotide sugar dehydrogenase [Nocardioides sp. MAH-18]